MNEYFYSLDTLLDKYLYPWLLDAVLKGDPVSLQETALRHDLAAEENV